jgi:hypothetical protein
MSTLDRYPSPEITNRIVLLGASNLAMSLRLVIEQVQYRCGRPSEVLVAAGHGRSYGRSSQFLIRVLPGIIDSGLWDHLSSAEERPTYALITDIGNDILYGSSPAQIIRWVDWCVDQLQKQSAQIVITNLPLASIDALPKWRYQLFRNLFYPYCQLSLDEVRARARSVHHDLKALAAQKQFILYEQNPEWIGVDAIHNAYWKRKDVYQQVCRHFSVPHNPPSPTEHRPLFCFSWKHRPQFASKIAWGVEKFHPQPSGLLADKTTVSLY